MSRPNLQVEELSDPEGEDDDNENGGGGDSRGGSSRKKPNVLCQELSSLVALSLNTPPANSTEQQTAALQSSKFLNNFEVFRRFKPFN